MEHKQDIYSIDFAETKVIWFAGQPLIIPEYFTFEQEKYIKASLRTLFFGNVSVDNILKDNYFKNSTKTMLANWENYERSDLKLFDDLRKEFFDFLKLKYNEYKTKLFKIDFEGTEIGYFHCGIIYKKLDSNFSALRMLIKYDYIYESYAIIRQMLEQIAFAYDTQFRNEITDFISPTKSISKLKEFYPNVGVLYGELSSKTHIDSSQFINHFIVDEENIDASGVILRSRQQTFSICLHILITFDLYCCVFENIFYNQLDDFKCLNKNKEIKKNRETKRFFDSFKKKTINLAEKHFR